SGPPRFNRLARKLMVRGHNPTRRPWLQGILVRALWGGPIAHLVNSRWERNFADAALSASRTDSSCGEPGIHFGRDHYLGGNFGCRAPVSHPEFEWRDRRSEAARIARSI